MELSKAILDFYDDLLDGHGVAKMIRHGMRKGLQRDHIRIAARVVYEKHHDDLDQFLANPLSVAKKVYELAKNESIKQLQKQEILDTHTKEELLNRIAELEKKLKPFSLYEWFPSEIYFYY